MGRSKSSIDILVKWDYNGTDNVVSTRELQKIESSYSIESRVERWCVPHFRFYQGVVIDAETPAPCWDDEDDIPLSSILAACQRDSNETTIYPKQDCYLMNLLKQFLLLNNTKHVHNKALE